MNIEIDYKQKAKERWYEEAIESLDKIYTGYMKYRIKDKDKAFLKYYRIHSSLKYFRRSIKSISNEDKIINLNTAFELLLIDNFEQKKRELMLLRIGNIMKKYRKQEDIREYLGNLISERNNIIHGGETKGININYKYLNKLYCHFILHLVNDIKKLIAQRINT